MKLADRCMIFAASAERPIASTIPRGAQVARHEPSTSLTYLGISCSSKLPSTHSEEGGNDSQPSYQEASGAPVQSRPQLGYSVGPVTIIFLNVSKMIGTGVYSTRA